MARRIQPNPGIVSFLFLILAALHLNAQVTLTQADMPAVNDTFRISTAVDISGQDPSLTGAAYTWDYSGLSALSQTLDTFLPMSTVPALYQLFFNNPLDPNKANLARKMPMLNLIPGFEIGDVYEFYRNNAQSFSFLGYAGELSGIPLAVKYDQPDVWYRFPLNFGAHDSSRSVFSLSLPGLGSFYSDRKRWNTVDGWGQLSTPFGTFQVLRQRSEVEEYDSLFLDTLGSGFGIQRLFTEYKWLAQGYGLPVLQVTAEGPLVTVTYLDSALAQGTPVTYQALDPWGLRVSVDQESGQLLLRMRSPLDGPAECGLYDLGGRRLMQVPLHLVQGENAQSLRPDSPLAPGVYLLRLSLGNRSIMEKVLVP